MKYFYDTEFIEDGRTIDLVSIGIACEDERKYYAVNRDCRWERVADSQFDWLRNNVWIHLPIQGLCPDMAHPTVKRKHTIAKEVEDFLLYGFTFPTPEYPDPMQMSSPSLWADYPAYDHVALCQLWGSMADKPACIPMRTNDITQLAEMIGFPEAKLPKQPEHMKHHALYDALHNMEVYRFLETLANTRRYVTGLDLPNQGTH